MPRDSNVVDGILLVDKPSDWTSHDVVACVRARFRLSKTGHCGTLDPMATGLLVLLLGKATKLQDRLMADEKVYEGTLRLGIETDSEDITGQVTRECDPSAVTAAALQSAAAGFVGEIEQIPPMVSAIKRDGKPLYQLARKGITVEREPRRITIHAFDILAARLPEADFRVRCSKGTYIRTLCADLGHRLGCGAVLTALRRTASGTLLVDGALTMEQLKAMDLEQLRNAVIPLDALDEAKPDALLP